jgi:hypothetical protein
MLPRSMKRVMGVTFQKTELKITVLSASPVASNWILSCQTLHTSHRLVGPRKGRQRLFKKTELFEFTTASAFSGVDAKRFGA